jgi:hypothetical protein
MRETLVKVKSDKNVEASPVIAEASRKRMPSIKTAVS